MKDTISQAVQFIASEGKSCSNHLDEVVGVFLSQVVEHEIATKTQNIEPIILK